MTGPVAPGAILLRMQVLMTAWVDSCGSMAAAQQVLGRSHGAMWRRCNDQAPWELADYVRAVAHEHAAQGWSPLLEALATAIDGHEQGSPLRAAGALWAELKAIASENGKLVEILADGRVDRAEAQAALEMIRRRRAAEESELIPDLEAIVDGSAP